MTPGILALAANSIFNSKILGYCTSVFAREAMKQGVRRGGVFQK
jgi:hypothetical protein